MIEHFIKEATCRVSCGEESGTGWLIGQEWAVTCRHCVLENIENGQAIELSFPSRGDAVVISTVVAQSEDLDACLLALESSIDTAPLSINLELPREGCTWQTFGYSRGKKSFGHRLSGTVAQVLEDPILKVDIDLSIDTKVALADYRGMSGAAVVCDGQVVGIIRCKFDGSIAALSLNELSGFLAENGVILKEDSATPSAPQLANRGDFPKIFTEAVQARRKKYIFLEGAHGYGKTTFCGNFKVNEKKLINLGAYLLSDPNSTLGPAYRAEPQVFIDWLTTVIATRLNGIPPRKEDSSYHDQIRLTADYLAKFSQYCEKSDRQGMLFIDGLNEIPSVASLNTLMGLLPAELPFNVTIVLTAPNYSNVAVTLSGKVKPQDVLSLPPLPDSDCYSYCWDSLHSERRTRALVNLICEKSKGHPLYLRYLIEYVSAQDEDDDLADFPVLIGPIEEYYESVWIGLLTDEGAVNLLALMARLRWGISSNDFSKALSQTEQAQYISVMSRIRHLLLDDESTAIYHSSFALFIVEKTAVINESVFRRLSHFCLEEPELDYCVLNRIFHLLRADERSVFAECNQDWFDKAVTLGVEPDALIADVNDVVKRAAIDASAAEFFRITFLAQRINFRYDTLFAQSARLIAEALIVLGRPDEALLHVVRQKILIIDPYEAFEIVYLLHHHQYDNEALGLLELIQQKIIANYDNPMELRDFLILCSLHIQAIFLIRLAGGWNGMKQANKVVEMAHRACARELQDTSADVNEIICPIVAEPPTYFLSFKDEHTGLKQIASVIEEQGDPEFEPPPHYLLMQCNILLGFENTVDRYRLVKSRKSLAGMFADLSVLLQSADSSVSLDCSITDTLIRFGAPSDVVEQFSAKEGSQSAQPLKIKSDNGVDVNLQYLGECLTGWRLASFMDPKFDGTSAGLTTGTEWYESLEHLTGTLFCTEGQARRALVDSDEGSLIECCEQLKEFVIEPLRFSLLQRSAWQDCYAIPENVLPAVYGQLAELLIDCFPAEVPNWLDDLMVHANDQLGMYSEGFRKSINVILEQLTREEPSHALAPRLLSLLHTWRDHVIDGVENRHELVPELLRMIPYFVALGAKEEAERLYLVLLSISMGPNWYKEDQLGIMNKVLSSIPSSIGVEERLPKIAGILEKASGEMTFQRYVRDEKSTLIGQIARRGNYRAALAYFRRQSCGSTEELWAEAQYGPIDKLGPLRGSRFPGSGLEEQSAVLALVSNASAASWYLRWAMLETFHCGDIRHVDSYARAYAEIVNEIGTTPEVVRRTLLVIDAETSIDDRTSFLVAFFSVLRSELHFEFGTYLKELPPVETVVSDDSEVSSDIDDDGLFSPGLFGHRSALRDAEEIFQGAEKHWNLGNFSKAKCEAVKSLQAVQDGGWGIWGGPSAGAVVRQAEDMLIQDESSASNVIRFYAPLIETDQHVQKWVHAEHLIGRAGSLLDESEGHLLLDTVIDHCQLVVGDAANQIQGFNFLSSEALEPNADIEFFRFFIWLCDHPNWIRRERASAMLLWLLEQTPELFVHGVNIAFSMDEGFGPDVLCGVLDGASARNPEMMWDKISDVLDIVDTTKTLQHVSRMAVLERLAERAADAGSMSGASMVKVIRASYIGKPNSSSGASLPSWAEILSPSWSQMEKILDQKAINDWNNELTKLCSPLSISDACSLEIAVSRSFRDEGMHLDRWHSKLRYALNLASWHHVSQSQAATVEAALRIYDPNQPEIFVIGARPSFSNLLNKAIKSGDYKTALVTNPILYLNYQELVVDPNDKRATHIELSCVLQPTMGQSKLIETWSRFAEDNLFFGSFAPAVPHSFFLKIAGVDVDDFNHENWRIGRVNRVQRLGMPENSGNSLSISREKLKSLHGFKLVWIVKINGKFITAIDQRNQRMG